MPTIKRHIPNFAGGSRGQEEIEFETLEDLLEIDYVKKAMSIDDFVEFKISYNNKISVDEVIKTHGIPESAKPAMEEHRNKLNFHDGHLMLICKDGGGWAVGELREIGAVLSDLGEYKVGEKKK